MKTIQSILFLVFISGFSIMMINSGRVSPQVEQQQNSYWTVIANTQPEPANGFEPPEPATGLDAPEFEQFSPTVGNISTRQHTATGYHPGYGRGSNATRSSSVNNRSLSAGNRNSAKSNSLNPLHSRIIQSPLQPMDLIISPEDASNYAVTLNTKTQ